MPAWARACHNPGVHKTLAMATGCTFALLAAGCGGDDKPSDGFTYGGTAGKPVAANFGDDLLPDVAVQVGAGATHLFTIDTGAPMVFLDSSVFSDHTAGVHMGETVAGFGLTFSGVTDVAFSISGTSGLFGGDLLRHFAFTLDYVGNRAWLSDPFDTGDIPSDVAAGVEQDMSFQLLGGATGLAFTGCTGSNCTLTWPATRVLVQATFEDATTPVWILVDTGSSLVVIDPAVFDALATDPNRPLIEGAKLTGVNGDNASFITRVFRVKLDGASGSEGEVVADNIVAAVIPDSTLLASVSSETGKPIKALVGGSYFRNFLTTIDYQKKLIRLQRYNDPQIDPGEWVGPGFVIDPSDYTAFEVYTNKDAFIQGMREGDTILQIGDLSLAGQPFSAVQAALSSYNLGETIPIVYSRGGQQQPMVQVLVENLLPDYPPPS